MMLSDLDYQVYLTYQLTVNQMNSGIFESRTPNTREAGSLGPTVNAQQRYQPSDQDQSSPEKAELERLKGYGAEDFINSIPFPSDELLDQLAYGLGRSSTGYKQEEFPHLLTQRAGMRRGEYHDQVSTVAKIASQLADTNSDRATSFASFRPVFDSASTTWGNQTVNEFGNQIKLFRSRAEPLLGANIDPYQESGGSTTVPKPEELAAVIDITIEYLQTQKDDASTEQLALCKELKASIDSEVGKITGSNERNRSYVVRKAIMSGVQNQLKKHGNRDLFESNGKDYYGIQRMLGIFRDAVEPESSRIQRKMPAQFGLRR